MGFFGDLFSGNVSDAWDDVTKSTGVTSSANPQQQQIGNTTGANLGQLIADRGNFATPKVGAAPQVQAANAGPTAQLNTPNDARNLQLGLANRLQAQAAGNGPSLAQLQFQQNQDANIAAAQAQVAANSRGINTGLANRIVANQAGQMNQAAAGQAAQLRMQEQMNANNQLAGVAGTLGQQDITQAGQNAQLSQAQAQYQAGLAQQAALQNAQLTQQVNLQNPQLALQAQQLRNGGQDSLLGLANQRDLGQLGSDQAFQEMLYKKATAEDQSKQKLFGGIASGVGNYLGFGATSGAGAAGAGGGGGAGGAASLAAMG